MVVPMLQYVSTFLVRWCSFFPGGMRRNEGTRPRRFRMSCASETGKDRHRIRFTSPSSGDGKEASMHSSRMKRRSNHVRDSWAITSRSQERRIGSFHNARTYALSRQDHPIPTSTSTTGSFVSTLHPRRERQKGIPGRIPKKRGIERNPKGDSDADRKGIEFGSEREGDRWGQAEGYIERKHVLVMKKKKENHVRGARIRARDVVPRISFLRHEAFEMEEQDER